MNQQVIADTTAKNPAALKRPEIELLLCCARTYIDFARAERIKILLKEDLDWDYLIQIALWQGVIPLLYSSLNSTCPQLVPTSRLAKLSKYFQINARNNLFLTGELLKLLNSFQAHSIPVIPYKGAILAAFAYDGKLGLRQFCDLDILIHERDILRTENLLISQGYQLQRQLSWEYHFVHQDSQVNVDLHWGITQKERPFPLDFDYLWSRRQPITIAGKQVVNLQTEDLLIILCVQITKDCWQWKEQLAKVCDIAELIRVQPNIDWNYVIERSRILGSERMLFLGLVLAHNLLGTALPPEILSKIQTHPVVETLALQVCERLLITDGIRGNDRPPKYLDLEKAVFYFRVRERWQDKVPYFMHLIHEAITPSIEDREFLPLHPSLSFLYYLIRPLRAVRKYGLNTLKSHLRL